MSRETTLIILAVIVILTPFLGLPVAWFSWVLPILGATIAGIGISVRMRHTAVTTSHESSSAS